MHGTAPWRCNARQCSLASHAIPSQWAEELARNVCVLHGTHETKPRAEERKQREVSRELPSQSVHPSQAGRIEIEICQVFGVKSESSDAGEQLAASLKTNEGKKNASAAAARLELRSTEAPAKEVEVCLEAILTLPDASGPNEGGALLWGI